LVPGVSGDGEEAWAVTEPLSVNNKQNALSPAVILRIFFPKFSARYHLKMSEWSKSYLTLTFMAGERKNFLM